MTETRYRNEVEIKIISSNDGDFPSPCQLGGVSDSNTYAKLFNRADALPEGKKSVILIGTNDDNMISRILHEFFDNAVDGFITDKGTYAGVALEKSIINMSVSPQVGIFWFKEINGTFKIHYSEGCPISDGMEADKWIIYPKAHKDVWSKQFDMEKDGKFDSVLRGRIFYDKNTSIFEVHTGYKEIPKELMAIVCKEFNLPDNAEPVYDDVYDVKSASMSKIGLLWLSDDYKVIDGKELKPFNESDLYKGNYVLIDRTHDSFDKDSPAKNRARIEIFNGIVKISVGQGCSDECLEFIKEYMGLDTLSSDKIDEFRDNEYDGNMEYDGKKCDII